MQLHDVRMFVDEPSVAGQVPPGERHPNQRVSLRVQVSALSDGLKILPYGPNLQVMVVAKPRPVHGEATKVERMDPEK